jgi:hypothetical protein
MKQIATAPGSAAGQEQKTDICPNEQQHACPNGKLAMPEVLENIGAGEGNRTLVFSLEGCCSTIELHPRSADHLTCHASRLNHPSTGRALTGGGFLPILGFPSIAKGGDPVSYTKRCHLAGIAR